MNDHVEEKQRVASLLSSIKTPVELDAIYAKEIGASLPNTDDNDEEEPVNDDFIL